MLDELRSLLCVVPAEAGIDRYWQAILSDNILNKSTASNRERTFQFLRRLYSLDFQVCIFREMRRLLHCATEDQKLLISLLAMAREPLLRACLGMVLKVRVGESMGRATFEAWIRAFAPGRYSESMFVSFSHNLYASFYQFGYLGESTSKARTRMKPKSGIASVTYAAFLDWLLGRSGLLLLEGEYSKALDLDSDEHLELLQAAGRKGLLKVAWSGGVLDLEFPGFLNASESRLIS